MEITRDNLGGLELAGPLRRRSGGGSARASGKKPQAVAAIQRIIDRWIKDDPAERGWYLQEMARHTWGVDRPEAEKLQAHAHARNPYVLKPRGGSSVPKLDVLVSQRRVERIVEWLQGQQTHQHAMIASTTF